MAKDVLPGHRRLTPVAVGADLLLIVWFIFSLFPIVWMVLLALKTESEQTSTYFTFAPTLENFGTVMSQRGTDLTSVNFSGALIGSVLSCGGAVLVSLIIGIPAAYAAGRWKYRGSEDLMFQMLSFRFAPELMVVVPLFVIYNQTGLFDTTYGMVWVLQLVTMPLVVWILRSYFQDLAPELEQAALLDGYTRKRAFIMVALPLVRPGIAAAALLAFIFAWNNYVFPLILTDSEATTVTVAVTKFLGGGGQAYYNLTAAAALIGALPPLILALTIQRYLVRGLSFGAVKA
jgi:multiple sugar transport system permease protein